MPYKYVPILKAKAGEAVALENLPNTRKARIRPLFRVGESVPTTFAPQLIQAWSGRVAALDGTFNYNFTGTTAHFSSLFAALTAGGVHLMPSIKIDAPPPYLAAVLPKIGLVTPGLTLRTPLASLALAAPYAGQNGWNTQTIDLVVEVGHIAEFDPQTFAGYVSAVIAANIGQGMWRSVALSASAAPKDFGGLAPGINIVPRRDWLMWNSVAQPAHQAIDFSDYAQSHLDLTEPPGVAMAKATVSVRYAADDHWIMIKGRPTTGNAGLPMGQQYRAHATTLMARPEFGGITGCWADSRITDISSGVSSPGGRPQWVAIGTNRHLSRVTTLLP